MKTTIAALFCLIVSIANAQSGFTRNTTISVMDSFPLELAWAGGLNYPQFSEIDLNNDANPDLFVFDRSNNRVLTFLNNGMQGTHCWDYAPQYESQFPSMRGWAVLYDYNCDSKPDILTVDFSNHGISQYRNDSQGGNVSFTLVDSTIKYICNCPIHFSNILASEFLAADFNDIDGDGDMDILAQQFNCIGSFAYYKNMSMEDFGVCDSIDDYVFVTNSWGKFALRSGSFENIVVGFWNINCFQSEENGFSYQTARRDDTYAHIKTIDIDGDGDKDALIGDSQTDNSLLVINGGTPSLAQMVSQDTLFPFYDVPVNIHSFSSHSYVDADNDGIKDIIVTQSEYENNKGVYFYKNTGTNAVPVLSHVENNFLQNELIDVGEGATAVLFDYDGDGLNDMFIGNKYFTLNDTAYSTGITLYKNNGTISSPAFILITDDFAGLKTIVPSMQVHGQIFPAFGDLDDDGDFDMVIGCDEGQLLYFMNTAGPGVFPVYAAPVASYMAIDIGQASTPQLFDLNRDGKLDLVVGEKNGFVNYFENVGTASLPFFSSTPTNDSLGGAGVVAHVQNPSSPDGYSSPFFFLQGGDTRMLVGSMKGDIYLYGNIDGNLNGDFTLIDTVYSKSGGTRYGYNITVSGGNLNGDTLVDMIVGVYGGGPQVFYQDSGPNGIASIELSSEISVRPNPVSESLIISNHSVGRKLSFSLFDLTGRLIVSGMLHQDITIVDVSNISPGAYFLKASDGISQAVRKIIVE